MVIKRVHFTSFTLQTNSIMPFGPIKTTLAVVGASIFSYYTISPAAKALFGKNDGEGGGGDGAAVDHGKNKDNEEDNGDGNDDGAASGAASGAANGDGRAEDNEQEESGAADNSQAEARAEEGEGDQ